MQQNTNWLFRLDQGYYRNELKDLFRNFPQLESGEFRQNRAHSLQFWNRLLSFLFKIRNLQDSAA